MKIFLFLISFLIIPQLAFTQLSGDIGLGYNRFLNDNNYHRRSNGLTLQFNLEKKLNNNFHLNYGIHVSIAQELYQGYDLSTSYDYILNNSTYFLENFDSTSFKPIFSDRSHYDQKSYALSFQFPVTIITQIIENKLYILTGISLNIDNYILLGNSFQGLDPGLGSNTSYYFPRAKLLGVGHHIGILYKPLNKVAIYCNWKTTQNRTFNFSYGEIGIQYRIFTNR